VKISVKEKTQVVISAWKLGLNLQLAPGYSEVLMLNIRSRNSNQYDNNAVQIPTSEYKV
jgi:hypothetical protein